MKRSLCILVFAAAGALNFTGCGGHEGGAIEVTKDNPYQLTPEDEAKRADKIAGSKDLKAEKSE